MPLQRYEKEQILNACFKVFVEHGYAQTSTAMLADAAGISKALIFHHFKSKKALYLSILGQCFHQMAMAVSDESPMEYTDYFDARLNSGFRRIAYLKAHPEINILLLEAFHETPSELKEDIQRFKEHMESNPGEVHQARQQWLRQLFDKIPLRPDLDRDQVYELINSTMESFNTIYLADLKKGTSFQDEQYWQRFYEKKKCFLNMIRYGIEQSTVNHRVDSERTTS